LQGVISNGPARTAGISQTLQQAGEISGDPFEISTIRREVKYSNALIILLVTISENLLREV